MDAEDATGLAQTQAGAVARRQPAAHRDAPPVFGRYVVVRRLGEGGMGVVWLARDPRLDRDVAIKVVRQSGRDPADSARRLRREAQALAQLSDPHVVHVFDVGESEDTIWIAMELVDGDNLERWSKVQPRSIAEIVAVFVQAAHGLQAAHTAGILHRDFKPSNVMIGRDGLVRVLDFGLARALAPARALAWSPEKIEAPAPIGEPLDTLRSSVTKSGAMVGTPAYMAPEQIRAEPLDARTDVFAFCVALFETLYGERPFQGQHWPQLAAAILTGRIADPPAERRVPHALHTIVLRGLAPDPADRYSDMAELLAALAPWQRSRQRAVLMPAIAGVAILVGGLTLFRGTDDTCDAAEHRISTAWNTEREAALRSAFTEQRAAGDVAVTRIDAWVDEWRETHATACQDEASDTRATLACLDRIARAGDVAIDLLLEGDPRVLARTDAVLAVLPDVRECADALAREHDPTSPEAVVAAAEIEDALAQARALSAAGRYGDALAAMRGAAVRAESTGVVPALAGALLELGLAEDLAGNPGDALTTLERAYAFASEARDDERAARAAIRIALVLTDRFDRVDEAEHWLRQAAALVQRTDDAELTSSLVFVTAITHQGRGDYDSALAEYQRALELRIAAHGEDHTSVHLVLNNMGNTLAQLGRHDEAIEVHRRVLASRERMYPADHPEIAFSLNNLANSQLQLGHYADARAAYERSQSILRAALGPESSLLIRSYDNLGIVADHEGRFADARASFEEALALRSRTLGEDHPDQAKTMLNLANLAHTVGNYEEARDWYSRGLILRERDVGPDHPEVALLLHNLAATLAELGQHADAVRMFRRSLAIRQQTLPASHPHTFGTRLDLATSLVDSGATADARAVVDDALAHVPATVPVERRLEAELVLFETALELDSDDEALALARRLHERIADDEGLPAELHARAAFGLARALDRANGPGKAVDELAAAALATAPPGSATALRIAAWQQR